jgi:hypothetical protein
MLDIEVDSVLNAARRVITSPWLGPANAADGREVSGLH